MTVICATRGELGERLPDPDRDGWPLSLVREAELCEAAAVLGVAEVEILGHADSGYDGDPPGHSLVRLPSRHLAVELVGRMMSLRPDVVLTLDGSDGHRDHLAVRDAVRLAASWLTPRPTVMLSSLPRSLMRRWVIETSSAEPDRAHLAGAVTELGRDDGELAVIDTSARAAAREAAIACHRSQRSPFDGLSPELRRAFLTSDHVAEEPRHGRIER